MDIYLVDIYLPVLLSSFLLGLTGGFGHCIGMCSPFVLYISGKFSTPYNGYSILIPHIKYTLGRITTYTVLGIVIGAAGNLGFLNEHIGFQKGLTITAGALLILFGVINTLKIHIKLPFAPNISRLPFSSSPYITGIVLGFLPCGLIAGALIMSAISTNAWVGGLSMALFGVGTSVSLILVALFGGMFLKYIPVAKVFFNILLITSGVYFIYKGLMLN